jgi:hypothetical protein
MTMTAHDVYVSQRWKNLKQRLVLERGLVCEHCGGIVESYHDCIPHHLTELTDFNADNVLIAYNPDNLILVHFRCHNEIHDRFTPTARRVFIVHGAPKCGKTTHVLRSAARGDLIVDLDLIRGGITPAGYDASSVKACVFAVRDALYDCVVTRRGSWRAAWITGVFESESELARMVEKFRAEPLFVEAAREVCVSRCATREQIGYVDRYFERHVPPG